jgi:hypothetical protein
MAKRRGDLSFQPIADAIAKVEGSVRSKKPVQPRHLQLLGALRAILDAYCRTQRPTADCGDYCFIAAKPAAARKKRARR